MTPTLSQRCSASTPLWRRARRAWCLGADALALSIRAAPSRMPSWPSIRDLDVVRSDGARRRRIDSGRMLIGDPGLATAFSSGRVHRAALRRLLRQGGDRPHPHRCRRGRERRVPQPARRPAAAQRRGRAASRGLPGARGGWCRRHRDPAGSLHAVAPGCAARRRVLVDLFLAAGADPLAKLDDGRDAGRYRGRPGASSARLREAAEARAVSRVPGSARGPRDGPSSRTSPARPAPR